MKKNIFKILSAFLPIILANCGGGGAGGLGSDAEGSSSKNLAITISGSRSFNPNISHGKIDYYLVSVSGSDMEDPVTERVGGNAEGVQVLGIPVGENRTITVEAYNINGLVIRKAVKEGVTIYSDAISSVDVAMHSVPVFTNITDGSAVSMNRLQFGIFGEPGSKLQIINAANEEEPLVDASLNTTFVDTTNEEGVFQFNPGSLKSGSYAFSVKDIESGASSLIKIGILESLTRHGFAHGAGGEIKKIADELVITNVGGPLYQNTTRPDTPASQGPFLQQIDNLY